MVSLVRSLLHHFKVFIKKIKYFSTTFIENKTIKPLTKKDLGGVNFTFVLTAILAGILLILLSACSSPTPPSELAPEPEIVQKAIALQLNLTQTRLTQQLNASTPDLEITQINVNKLEPVYIAKLPAYHLLGNYDLTIKLPRQQVNQKNNPFDIYVQRQVEGKTWRLLRRETKNNDPQPKWYSYLIR